MDDGHGCWPPCCPTSWTATSFGSPRHVLTGVATRIGTYAGTIETIGSFCVKCDRSDHTDCNAGSNIEAAGLEKLGSKACSGQRKLRRVVLTVIFNIFRVNQAQYRSKNIGYFSGALCVNLPLHWC